MKEIGKGVDSKEIENENVGGEGDCGVTMELDQIIFGCARLYVVWCGARWVPKIYSWVLVLTASVLSVAFDIYLPIDRCV